MTTVSQQLVTNFYDDLIFPSKSSHKQYENLVPDGHPDAKFGDFGCGQSLFIEAFRRNNYDAVFVDISERVIERIDYGEKVCASLTDIPFPDGTVDYSFCIGVVHHIPDIEEAIRELIRVTDSSVRLYLGVYAPRTVQARLRKCHEVAPRLLRPLIRFAARLGIWYKNRTNGVRFWGEQIKKRISDLLDTPLVRYDPVEKYDKIIQRAGGRIDKVQRISQTNVLIVSKI